MKYLIGLILVVIFLFSCENKFPDYLKIEDDIYLKLISFEEGNKGIEDANYVAVSITIKEGDNVIFRQYKENIFLIRKNNFTFLMKNLNEGDSAVFKVATSRIYDALSPLIIDSTKSDFVKVMIKIYNYYSDSEYLASKNEFDGEMLEQLLLSRYIEEVGLKMGEGILKNVLVEGIGETVKKGDEITIAYKGYFINRLKFDEISGSTAFTFKYGTQGQVIKGLDIAIKSMREGEKSKIIIPSHLAFGEEGSTTLIVPSFTTVIYELEILKIN